MFLFCPSWGPDASQHRGWEFSDVICSICEVLISISKSLSTMVKWSSHSPPKCPSECLPRITRVPENSFSLSVHPASFLSLSEGCVPNTSVGCQLCVLCSALLQGWGDLIPWHFTIERVTSEFGHCWKEPPVVWHVNRNAACLAPLSINLPNNSCQESSLLTNFIPNILCTAKYLKQKKIRLIF